MPRAKRRASIGANPLDIIPTASAPPEQKAYKARLTVHVPPELVEEARDCAYWTRRTLARIVAEGLRNEIDRLRTDENKGKPFPKRSGELKTGRPIGAS